MSEFFKHKNKTTPYFWQPITYNLKLLTVVFFLLLWKCTKYFLHDYIIVTQISRIIWNICVEKLWEHVALEPVLLRILEIYEVNPRPGYKQKFHTLLAFEAHKMSSVRNYFLSSIIRPGSLVILSSFAKKMFWLLTCTTVVFMEYRHKKDSYLSNQGISSLVAWNDS